MGNAAARFSGLFETDFTDPLFFTMRIATFWRLRYIFDTHATWNLDIRIPHEKSSYYNLFLPVLLSRIDRKLGRKEKS